ncbi:MAG: hypothetical protein BGO57_14675 [Sphingomonadales bacterium 63-6]|nr:MAG: hypothetical protein BGO57_14675 [Sphingomonadales bacterium 63-6]
MKKLVQIALASAVALTLSACGSSDDASTDAMADDVEVPADEAMTGAEEAGALPAADAQATEDAAPADDATTAAEAAGNAAADAVADVEAAAAESTGAKTN